MYGSNIQSDRRLISVLVDNGKLVTTDGNMCLSDLYLAAPVFQHDAYLVSVQAIPEFMPHLVTWAEVTVPRKNRLMSDDRVCDVLRGYLANMTDEEILVVRSQIVRLHQRYGIRAIDCYADGFTVHAEIEGKNYSMIVSVFNMIEGEGLDYLGGRDSLN